MCSGDTKVTVSCNVLYQLHRDVTEPAVRVKYPQYWSLIHSDAKSGAPLAPAVQIVDVLSLAHPCRLYTQPDAPARALVATQPLPALSPIIVYRGHLREKEEFHATDDPQRQAYAFDVPSPIGYDGPELVLDSRVFGNEARYVCVCG